MSKNEFLNTLLTKMSQMMDPAMMGGAPPGGGMPPPPMGMPPVDPSMMGGAPPMDPSMMGGAPPMMDPAMMGGAPPAGGEMPPLDPAMLSALMGAGPDASMGGEAGAGEITDKELAAKAMNVAESAMQLALAQGAGGEGATDAAAGSLLTSGALEGISPEEIMALNNEEAAPQEVEPAPGF
jgi:hypothetical protein